MRRSAMVAALGLFASCLLLSAPAFAQSAALSGRVTSEKEGAMEGVVVSAKKVGSTVTVSVPTDDKGQFSVTWPTGPLRCFAKMMSASPRRSDSLS